MSESNLSPNNDPASKQGPNEFLVVGLGASAGGIQALQAFFEQVPADSGMAYVVILHLSPDHESRLAQVLQTVAKIPVAQVTEKVVVEPNHVYVVPPNQHLTMMDGSIIVSPNMLVEERRAPVDIFFRTLADSLGQRAVCVVLSGTGANGSMGLKRIKECGGAAFVQNPREAEFNEMPRNSIATELVDDILPVASIPAKIIAYKENLGKVKITAEPTARPESQQQALREIFTQLRRRTGHDFSNYKRPTMLRRIERRINVRHLSDLPAYTAFIHENPEEVQALLKDLLISVTNFFRDRKSFEVIERDILPNLLHEKTSKEQVRIWVVGCATGEEAYSLAMLCAERALGVVDAPKVQIFATDIDEMAIATAREGLYTINDAADVSPERLRRFFIREGDEYRIRREIREMVLFTHHNVLKDPPFSHLDLVSCRNLMIYLNGAAQERVIETFHFALNPGGYLFLGNSESTDGAGDLFATVSKEHHIFQSRQTGMRKFPVPESTPKFRFDAAPTVPTPQEQGKRALERITYGDLHQQLLEQYAPPSVLVNEDYDIVHLSERAGRYLQIAGGEPSMNLLKVVREELRLELHSALYQAVQRQTNVEAKNLKIQVDGRTETINLYVRPVLRQENPARGFMLVLFEASDETDEVAEPVFTSPDPLARQLEEELTRSKARLRTSIEQYEIQAEELKASNEELQAMNEELRSAAEELETSKEELQSINEELRTVNQELKVRIEETSITSNNLQNLINSTDIGTIFLDRSFRIQLFTPAVREIFNVIPNDIGRPLSDITHRLEYQDLVHDAELLLEKLQTIEREVRTTDNRVFTMRVLPYRTAEDQISGVVITFFDITARKRAEEITRQSEEQFRRAIEDAPIPVIMHAEDGEVLQVSRTWVELTGYTIDDVPTFDAWLTRAYGEGAEAVRDHMHSLFKGDQRKLDVEFPIRTRSGELRHWSFSASSPGNLGDGRRFIVGMAVDITERKHAEEAVAEDLKDTKLLRDVGAGFTTEDDIQTFYKEVIAAAIALTRADAGTVQILDEKTQELVLLASEGFDRKMTDHFHRVGINSNTPCGIALARNERTFVDFDVPASADPGGSLRMHVEAGYLSAQSTPLVTRSGKPLGMFTTHWREHHRPTERQLRYLDLLARQAADLIGQWHSQEALRQSEERLRLMMESVTDYAILITDTEGRIERWNPGAECLFGWTEAETIGQPCDIIFTPEDRAAGAPEKERQQARESGRAADERWHICKDGSRFYVSGVMSALHDGKLSGFVKIARDLTERKQTEEELRRSREQLEQAVQERTKELSSAYDALVREVSERRAAEARVKELLRQVISAQENERRRISRELHDSLGQQLTALRIEIEALQKLGPKEVNERLATAQEMLKRLDAELDFLAWELRPAALDELGLIAAVTTFVEEWSKQFETAADFHTSGLGQGRLAYEIETNLYRIVQEALNNVAKHARAKRASVILERRDQEVVLIIEDDGVGFDPQQEIMPSATDKGLGLVGMRERAALVGGVIEIESSPNNGATIFVRTPFAPSNEEL